MTILVFHSSIFLSNVKSGPVMSTYIINLLPTYSFPFVSLHLLLIHMGKINPIKNVMLIRICH